MGNTLEYCLRSFQVKRTILKCTKVILEKIEILTLTERDVGVANVYVTQFKNLNMKKLRKRFQI